jgi:UDP-glucose 4-epimerase
MALGDRKVLVTGGSGFIASHLVRRLVHADARVSILTKYNSVIDNTRLAGLWDRITPIEADLRNLDSLSQLRSLRPEIIFHFAAYNHVGDSFLHVNEAIESNARGSANLLEACEDYARFIYISSSEVYGFQDSVPFCETANPFPISPYAIGKYAGELYARMKYHVERNPIVVLRPFNAFGPYQSPRAVIAEIILTCLKGDVVCATEGRQTRDFNFVENLVDGFMLAAERDEAIGEVINIGSGREISIRTLVELIHRLTGSRSELRIGALPYRPTEIWRMVASNEKAARLLGWEPKIGLEKGLEQSIEWYRRFLAEFCNPKSSLCQLGL